MYMILYKVKASRLLFICKVQNLTCPQSLSYNAHSGNRGWCPHTPCAISRVQNHPAREQATHWDEINNTKEITILLCLFPVHLFLSSISFTCPKFYWHIYLRLHTKQVRFLLSNALHVTRIQFQTQASYPCAWYSRVSYDHWFISGCWLLLTHIHLCCRQQYV